MRRPPGCSFTTFLLLASLRTHKSLRLPENVHSPSKKSLGTPQTPLPANNSHFNRKTCETNCSRNKAIFVALRALSANLHIRQDLIYQPADSPITELFLILKDSFKTHDLADDEDARDSIQLPQQPWLQGPSLPPHSGKKPRQHDVLYGDRDAVLTILGEPRASSTRSCTAPSTSPSPTEPTSYGKHRYPLAWLPRVLGR